MRILKRGSVLPVNLSEAYLELMRVRSNTKRIETKKAIDICFPLLEKASPIAPAPVLKGFGFSRCHSCGSSLVFYDPDLFQVNYCPNCGQKQDWRKEK